MAQEASNSTGPSSPEAEPPYFDRFLDIIEIGGITSNNFPAINNLPAINNFDKKFLTSIHEKCCKYLTQPHVEKILEVSERRGKRCEVRLDPTEISNDLVPVNLKMLKIGRNECVVLYGKLCVEAFQFGRVFTVLEDVETNMAVALSIACQYTQSCDQSLANGYPQNKNVAIKEPMLIQAKSGLIFIQVDNPISIELEFTKYTVGQQKFKSWMDCAKYAYGAKEWEKCIRNCNKCEISNMKGLYVDNRTLLDLYHNRYHAQMELGRYAEALQDAENCCMRDPSDINGFKNKIRALLALGRYKEAYRLLKTRQDTEDQDFTSTYRKWATFYFDMSTPDAFKPDGDFIGPVEIRRTSNGCGRGLFATENIEEGEVVLISKALAVSDKVIGDPINNGLLQRLKEALSSSGDNTSILFLSHVSSMPHRLSHFLPEMSYFMKESAEENNLSGGKGKNVSRAIYDNLLLHVIDRIALDNLSPDDVRLRGIKALISNVPPMRLYNGVWLLVSFINHSCAPNAARISDGDVTRIHATRNIEKGQEITIPYFGVLVSYHIRQQFCQLFNFGCLCKCKRCDVERRLINSDLKVQKLYDDYLLACRPDQDNRSSSLMPLLEQVEDLLRNFNAHEEIEAWIRSSFLVVYLAHVSSRNSNPCSPPSIITPTLVLKQAHSIFQTCPGDVQILIFCQFCLKFLQCPEDGASTSTSPLQLMFDFMQKVCLRVYGQQREGILKAVFERFMEDTFSNESIQ